VRNQGAGPAGPFSVLVVGFSPFSFAGLAAGAEATRTYASGCSEGTYEARADYLNQVAESNEANNTRIINVIC
jgi:subtilase family serine protease